MAINLAYKNCRQVRPPGTWGYPGLGPAREGATVRRSGAWSPAAGVGG